MERSNSIAWSYAPWVKEMLFRGNSDEQIHGFDWSGRNTNAARTVGANQLDIMVNDLVKDKKNDDKPLMLMTHSHGRQLAILYLNKNIHMLKEMGKEVVLITMNAPVRKDYELSQEAKDHSFHVQIFTTRNMVVPKAGGDKNRLLKGGRKLGIYHPF